MDSLISVIVPIYNMEDYLIKCIESIINQTYKKLEIILVDDGSTDNCGIICDAYKLIDSRIKVIHKSNGGLSSARNAGLDIATGSLIGFVDSDDYLESTMYEKLKNNMDYYQSDISVCNFYHVKNGKREPSMKKLPSNIAEGKNKFDNMHNEYIPYGMFAWNKLFKRELFDNIRYPDGKIYEDIYITCDLLEKANRVSYTLEPLYNYVFRDGSICNSFTINHFDKISSINNNIKFFNKKKYYNLSLKAKNEKSYVLVIYLAKMKLFNINNETIYNKYHKDLLNTVKDIKWTEATNKVKLFKIFKNLYIKWNYLERKIYYSLIRDFSN